MRRGMVWPWAAAAESWRLPDGPDGLVPSQSWHAIGSSPDGTIFIGGMDHKTNSALFSLAPGSRAPRFLGDARSASMAAKNWQPGETAEKFHTRPLWHQGKIYVASLDRSSLDGDYLTRRGFHWYAYDPRRDSFVDLSAAEPGGVGAAHGGLVTLAADNRRNLIYGAGEPTGDIFRYDVARAATVDLGRPPQYDRPYVYAGRVMWVDSRGRLYFTAGNPYYGSYDPAIYGKVFFYDPDTGFGERSDWRLQEPRALEMGQCSPDRARCYFSDDQGHVYRFDDAGPSWTYLGRVATLPPLHWFWVFDVSPDERKAYLVSSNGAGTGVPTSLYEFDLATGQSRVLCSLADLDPEIGALDLHTGYDAWDANGRFYIASFRLDAPTREVVLTRIDPLRVAATFGKSK